MRAQSILAARASGGTQVPAADVDRGAAVVRKISKGTFGSSAMCTVQPGSSRDFARVSQDSL
jgi:hypothetical protein